MCSSLMGSECFFINRLEPQRYVQGVMLAQPPVSSASSSLSSSTEVDGQAYQDLEKVMLAALKIQQALKKKVNATGSFKVLASIYDDSSFQVLPVAWIVKPGPSWILIGISGELRESHPDLFFASIFDPENANENIADCSHLVMKRVSRGLPEIQPSLLSRLEGSWEGEYTCHEAKTKATLTLTRTGQANNEQMSKLSGVFSFHAKRG